jgi:hypothetical protein
MEIPWTIYFCANRYTASTGKVENVSKTMESFQVAILFWAA